ncbi:hypothetical protein BU23DRAFT_628522 [Bimuria novae-zelandiae CBS 107.79]|uniref:Uncharacterized protein n=1 Tax=Bimuria novae-zelandiae CBS 107.79 TaxID=1447943 RepID=A0A6A5VI75_9PLEO|nr:hypothetical protein BU23DRAFT_628522 [Bimuria novae-zelandiae CBS 107.79]
MSVIMDGLASKGSENQCPRGSCSGLGKQDEEQPTFKICNKCGMRFTSASKNVRRRLLEQSNRQTQSPHPISDNQKHGCQSDFNSESNHRKLDEEPNELPDEEDTDMESAEKASREMKAFRRVHLQDIIVMRSKRREAILAEVTLANASRLKPEIRLAQAVTQFEADLSNEQKTTFRIHRSQVFDASPDSNDIMRLTAEIDRRASRNAGGRCFGPRFTNFLQVVQQFAALGDVVVGGSMNIIALAIWSLSVANFSSYLEKLSTLFMHAGRSAPRYSIMAQLYSRSTRLQSSLSEYFIVVVRLCHQLLKSTQKPTLKLVTSTLNDSDLRVFQTELDFWATSIKEEVTLVEAQKIQEEASTRELQSQGSDG